jgi:hypothetical protein
VEEGAKMIISAGLVASKYQARGAVAPGKEIPEAAE